MAKRRGSRGGSRGRGGPLIVSGQSAGSNSNLVSQSGGIAKGFQSTNGSSRNKYGPGSTGSKRPSNSNIGWLPGTRIAGFGPAGDSAEMRSGRKSTPGVTIKTTGNTGRTNASVVMPRALGPKGFGGNYRLSKGY